MLVIIQVKIKKHNLKWPCIPDHPYKILIIVCSGSGKTSALLNLENHQPEIDKIYLQTKNPYEAKYQILLNKRESKRLKYFNDPRAFIKYSNDTQDVYKNIDKYIIGKKCKILIVFDDMIADMINNKKINPVVAELLIRGRKLNISIVFVTQSYCKVPKKWQTKFYMLFNHENSKKREIQQISLNHSSDIDSKDFIKIYKKSTAEPYSF